MTTTRTLNLATLFVFLAGVADALTTWIGLRSGQHEMNGFAASLFDQIGLVPTLALRVALPAIGVYYVLRWAKFDRVIHTAALGAVVFVTVGWVAISMSNQFGWL